MTNFLNQREKETLQNILCRWSRAWQGTGGWGRSETILWFPSVPSSGKSRCSFFFFSLWLTLNFTPATWEVIRSN